MLSLRRHNSAVAYGLRGLIRRQIVYCRSFRPLGIARCSADIRARVFEGSDSPSVLRRIILALALAEAGQVEALLVGEAVDRRHEVDGQGAIWAEEDTGVPRMPRKK